MPTLTLRFSRSVNSKLWSFCTRLDLIPSISFLGTSNTQQKRYKTDSWSFHYQVQPMLPSIRPVPYHDPTYEKIITLFVLRFLIYNFSEKEAFWNEGEHFSFNNESFERPLAWSRDKCRRGRSVQTELMWVGFSWLKLQFFNFNFFIQTHCIFIDFYWFLLSCVLYMSLCLGWSGQSHPTYWHY